MSYKPLKMVFIAKKFYQDMSQGLDCDIGDQEWAENTFYLYTTKKI